jgi:hypothetical protein
VTELRTSVILDSELEVQRPGLRLKKVADLEYWKSRATEVESLAETPINSKLDLAERQTHNSSTHTYHEEMNQLSQPQVSVAQEQVST